MNITSEVVAIPHLRAQRRLRLTTFFLLVFAVSWIGVLPMVLASWYGAAALPEPLKLLQGLMILGPGLVALWAAWWEGQQAGLRQLLRGLFRWRVNVHWYSAVLLGPALLFGLSLGSSQIIGLTPRAFYPLSSTLQIFLVTLLSYLLLNTEELAWRGYALPRLQATLGPLGASLVLWLVGMLFHVPLFLLRGGHPAGYPFWLWALLLLGLTLIFTWIFNGTSGSILLVHLFHQSINAWVEAIPLYPIATQSLAPIGIAIGLLLLVAGVAVWSLAKTKPTLLVLLVLIFTPYPLTAASQPAGFDPKRLDAFVRQQVARHGLPGLALAVVEGDQIVQLAGYGKADERGRPITPQTPFVLASVSKPLTALAIMQLVEAGKVELDMQVQRYLPEFRLADPVAAQQITVRHLLNHTSGIPEAGCQNSRFGAKTLADFVTALQAVELAAPVGARHLYCSGNYNILGYLIERVSGQSYADYMQQQIFAPLAMRHSFTNQQTAQQAGLAQGYQWLFGLPVPADYPYDAAQMPSGFLIASAEDLAHFLLAQLNGGRFGDTALLSAQGLALMHAPGVVIGNGSQRYGLGWQTKTLGGVPVIAHAGDHPNVHTLLVIEPATRRGAVLLLNSQNMVAQFGAFLEIETGVVRLLAGQEPAPPPRLRLPTIYLLINLVLGGLLLLALWSLLRLCHWEQQVRQPLANGQLRLGRLGVRLGWAIGWPLLLLLGARLLLHRLGAQSWQEGLLLFPDFILWLWVFTGLLLLTGALRLVLLWRLLGQTGCTALPQQFAGVYLRL